MRIRALLLAALAAGSVAAVSASPLADAPFRFMVAQSLALEGSYGEALAIYEQLVRDVPEEAFVRIEYAELLFRLGRLAEAAEQVAEARRIAPRDPGAARLFGQIHLQLAETDPAALERAREAFEELRVKTRRDLEAMVALGQIYLSQGRMDEAGDLFGELLDERPGDRMLMSFLIDALRRARRVEEAEARLADFLQQDPEFLRAWLSLAEIRSERGDHEAAAQTLERAREALPGEPEIERVLAIELYRIGEPERALAAVERLLAAHPGEAAGAYLRALVLLELEREEAAEGQLVALLADDPENLDAALLLAGVRERQGRMEEAAAAVDEVERRLRRRGAGERASRARLELAQIWARGGEWSRVLGIAEAAGESAGGAEMSLLRAEALRQLERPEDALAALAAVPGDGPLGRRAAAGQAEILFELAREDEALARLRPLADSPEPDDLELAAEVYQRLERHADAIPLLLRAVELRPDSVATLFRLAASCERTGRVPEAERWFRELLELDPEFAPALNYLGYMWADLGMNLSEALDLVLRAVDLDPDNGAYVDSLGWAYFRLGRFDEARDHLERAATLEPDDAVIHEHLGDLYQAVGQLEQARDLYERALALDGDNEEKVRRKLRELSDNL